MPVIVDKVESGYPGKELLLGSQSETGEVAVVFEDDGETAYFYACESVNSPIWDALHIYDAVAVVDREQPSEYKIGWSTAGRQAILMINGYAHAVFDFDRKKGWCRSGFPPCNQAWSLDGHGWDEACLEYFR
jgi:hypothetical protein